jgi:hypothetical protein
MTGMQEQRYELKYIVPESITHAVRSYVSSHLAIGRVCLPIEMTGSYKHSQHLLWTQTTFTLTTQADQGDRNRFKLRVRLL